ncbi:MAG: hypothetical protein ACYC0D_09650, partial [Candidatus Humimicrobiaceae bacterium]
MENKEKNNENLSMEETVERNTEAGASVEGAKTVEIEVKKPAASVYGDPELQISHSPHIWSGFSTSKIMYIFLASLILPTAAA